MVATRQISLMGGSLVKKDFMTRVKSMSYLTHVIYPSFIETVPHPAYRAGGGGRRAAAAGGAAQQGFLGPGPFSMQDAPGRRWQRPFIIGPFVPFIERVHVPHNTLLRAEVAMSENLWWHLVPLYDLGGFPIRSLVLMHWRCRSWSHVSTH